MTIRAFYSEDALLRHVMETNEDIANRTAALEGLPELATRAERVALDDAVRELGSALQGYLALRYIGPLPAYSFSELALESGEE